MMRAEPDTTDVKKNGHANGSFFSRHRVSILLFLFAFVVRACVALIGAPYCYQPDEHWIFAPAFKMVAEHTWDLDWFRVPPLLIMMFRQLVSLLQLSSPADLTLPKESWFDPLSIMPHQFPVLYAGRLLVSLFGALSVVLLFRTLSRHISFGMSLLFSVVYACISTVIFYSSFLRPETLVIFFLLLSTYYLDKYAEEKKRTQIMISGAAFGLACASKYNAAVFFISAVLYLYLIHSKLKPTLRAILIYVGSALLLFIVSIPHFFWKLFSVVGEITEDYNYYMAGDLAFHNSKYENFTYYLFTLYRPQSFFILFWIFVGVLGALYFVKEKIARRSLCLLYVSCFFVVTYVIFLSQFSYTAERNLSFVYPFIILAVAIFITWIVSHSSHVKWIGFSILAGVVVTTGIYSVEFVNKSTKKLPQDHVLSWIHQNAEPNSFILREIQTPLINPQKYQVLYYPNVATIKPSSMIELNPKYIVLTRFTYQLKDDFKNDYPREFVDWIWSKTPEFEDNNPDQIPLGASYRIYDFQKLKSEYKLRFKKWLSPS